MVSQTEVINALRKIGGAGTTREVYMELQKEGKLPEYKHKNSESAIVGATLTRCIKWKTIRKEFRRTGYTGKPMHGITTWVLEENI